MTDYTIVEPGFEFIPPPEQGKELEFLELATRTCYKSEGGIKPGSAEKLMKKVVKEYEHYSVTEHANCILKLSSCISQWDNLVPLDTMRRIIIQANPLLASRITVMSDEYGNDEWMMVSGNVRMFMDALEEVPWLTVYLGFPLHLKWPFFFDEPKSSLSTFEVLDENPITNRDKLERRYMLKHMTLTYRLIGDRSMSHQLVRHRLFAFSQESQRYCNYGKKGFQFVVPPSADDTIIPTTQTTLCDEFIAEAVQAYKVYLAMLDAGLKPEDARGLLPNCCKTEVVTTGTLGYWINHIFPHRALNPKAQWQIRGIMLGIREHMMEILPELFPCLDQEKND